MIEPWTDVTFVGVYWNDPDRVEKLLETVRPWFTHIVCGVQTDDKGRDETLSRVVRWADETIVDKVHGFCEPTIGRVLGSVKTDWVFLVSADETPSTALLESFQDMLDEAAVSGYDGFWLRMISSIEGIDYISEQDNHLRVFKRHLSWPHTMHSRPDARNAKFWRPEAYLRHDRSLDEMIIDYLRYYSLSGTNSGWLNHNREMMMNACTATAAHYDWAKVKAYEWWPKVLEIAFNGVDPEPIGE